MRPKWKTIGVLGGMGPEASAEFYRRIIETCQQNYGAKYDSDFPPVFIYNVPLPEIVEKAASKKYVVSMLKAGIGKLGSAGCDFIVVPCNTVGYFTREIKSDIPMLNPVMETYKEAKRRGINKVGVLSTTSTAKNRLYESVFIDIEVLQPPVSEQNKINEIILRILAGWKNPLDKEYLKLVSRKLQARGTEAVILGCTDLPLLISQKDVELEILDTLQILVENTLKISRGDGCG